MSDILPHDTRDKINIKPNELVVSTVANRPHNKLFENDEALCDFVGEMTLTDLTDVGATGTDDHSLLPAGDKTAGGEDSPTVLVRKDGSDLFLEDTINEDTVNILRPTLTSVGAIRISPGSWMAYADENKQTVFRRQATAPIIQIPNQISTAPFVEYLVAEDNIAQCEVYSSEEEALVGLGFYIGYANVEYDGSANVYTSFVDKRTFTPTLSPGVEIVDDKYLFSVRPWSEEFDVTVSGLGQSFTTTNSEHQYQFGNLLQVFVNGENMILGDDYIEINQTTVSINGNLDVGDVVKMSNLVGIQDVTYNLPQGTYSPSYTQKTLSAVIAIGSIDTVGFVYEAGTGWMAVYVDGEKMLPGTDYTESDSYTVTWLTELPIGSKVEYHYAVGFTRLASKDEVSDHHILAGQQIFNIPGLTSDQELKLFMSGILLRTDQYSRSGVTITLGSAVTTNVVITSIRTVLEASEATGQDLEGLTYNPLSVPSKGSLSNTGNNDFVGQIDLASLTGSAIPEAATHVKMRYSIRSTPQDSGEVLDSVLHSWTGDIANVTLFNEAYIVAGNSSTGSTAARDFATQVVPMKLTNTNNVKFGVVVSGTVAATLNTVVDYWVEGYYLEESAIESPAVTDEHTAFAAVESNGNVVDYGNCIVTKVGTGKYEIEVISTDLPTNSRSAVVATLYNSSAIDYSATFNQPGIFEIQTLPVSGSMTKFLVYTYKTSGTLQFVGGDDGNNSLKQNKAFTNYAFNVIIKWA